jgi:hypothetical protein
MKAREFGIQPPIDPDEYVFTFGKYKGKFYGDIREQWPQYIQWCDDALDWFNLPDDEREYIDELVAEEQEHWGEDPQDHF